VDWERQVPADLCGWRLDAILAELIPQESKAALQKIVRRGKVFVDGERVLRSNIRPRRAARLRVSPWQVVPAPSRELPLLFEDEHLVVIDKPAGLLTHGNEKGRGESLADLAVGQFGRLPILLGSHRPGIVHRLDRETSGVMVLAKTEPAMKGLQQAFRERQVRKEYLALVHGRPSRPSQTLRWDLGPQPGHPDRQQALAVGRGKSSQTRVCLERRLGPCSLMRCRPRTGRRHQIRVHLHTAGIAVVADKLYGARRAPRLPAGAPGLAAHALHAAAIAFCHPVGGADLRFEAPLRDDLRSLIAWLGGERLSG